MNETNLYWNHPEITEHFRQTKEALKTYQEEALLQQSNYQEFAANGTYRGKTAEEARAFLGESESTLLAEYMEAAQRLEESQERLLMDFQNEVDSSPQAVLTMESLNKVQKDYRELEDLFLTIPPQVEAERGKHKGVPSVPERGEGTGAREASQRFEALVGEAAYCGSTLWGGYLQQVKKNFQDFDSLHRTEPYGGAYGESLRKAMECRKRIGEAMEKPMEETGEWYREVRIQAERILPLKENRGAKAESREVGMEATRKGYEQTQRSYKECEQEIADLRTAYRNSQSREERKKIKARLENCYMRLKRLTEESAEQLESLAEQEIPLSDLGIPRPVALQTAARIKEGEYVPVKLMVIAACRDYPETMEETIRLLEREAGIEKMHAYCTIMEREGVEVPLQGRLLDDTIKANRERIHREAEEYWKQESYFEGTWWGDAEKVQKALNILMLEGRSSGEGMVLRELVEGSQPGDPRVEALQLLALSNSPDGSYSLTDMEILRGACNSLQEEYPENYGAFPKSTQLYLTVKHKELKERADREGREVISMAADFLPVTGEIKCAEEAIFGENLITGRELGPWERIASGTILAGNIIKPVTRLARAGRKLESAEEAWKVSTKSSREMLESGSKSGSKTISYTDYDNIYQSSIHNTGKEKVMLGKYDGGGPTSYITKAGDDYTYFSLGDEWNTIKAKYGYTDDDMFKLFNEAFLDDGINAGKTFQFSHNPVNDTGALGQEYQYLLKNNYKWDAGTMTMKPRY